MFRADGHDGGKRIRQPGDLQTGAGRLPDLDRHRDRSPEAIQQMLAHGPSLLSSELEGDRVLSQSFESLVVPFGLPIPRTLFPS